MANELVSGLSKAIIRGSQLAVSLAKTCITTPVLINTDIKQGAQYAIPLYVETNQKSAGTQAADGEPGVGLLHETGKLAAEDGHQ